MLCRKCNKTKDAEEFRKIAGGKRDTLCKECFNIYQHECKRKRAGGMLYRERRAQEKERCCTTCGQAKPIEMFRLRKEGDRIWRGSMCMDCHHKTLARRRHLDASTKIVTEKICCRCHKTFPINEFTKNRSQKDGHNCFCKECRSYLGWRRTMELKERFLTYKATLSCIVCGEKDMDVLEFHHRDPNEKEYRIAGIYSVGPGWDKIKAELDKCDVLCANCHRKKHNGKQQAENTLIWKWGLKKGKKCVICGEDHYSCLDFHHRDPKTKKFGINKACYGRKTKVTKEEVLHEVAKCDILCRNCHIRVHKKEGRRWSAPPNVKRSWGLDIR